jgi:hypothetical protein
MASPVRSWSHEMPSFYFHTSARNVLSHREEPSAGDNRRSGRVTPVACINSRSVQKTHALTVRVLEPHIQKTTHGVLSDLYDIRIDHLSRKASHRMSSSELFPHVGEDRSLPGGGATPLTRSKSASFLKIFCSATVKAASGSKQAAREMCVTRTVSARCRVLPACRGVAGL